jgi:hypothetical protein
MVEHLALEGRRITMTHRRLLLVALLATAFAGPAGAQPATVCRLLCELEWKIEPTFTIDNLASRHRVVTPDGSTERVDREFVFETVFALDMSTRLSWLGVTVEAITAPFADDNEVQLEFEANFHWLSESKTGGWVSSHFDIVDKFSPAERPGTSRAYTHKLDLELDTALHVFNWLPEGRWLRGVEFETSLDYLATGLPRKGDVLADGTRFLDDASPWSLSLVIVIPVAPF